MIRKQSSDTLRFLFGSLVCYPPFAGTRSYATQTPLGGGNIANLTTEAFLPSVRFVFESLWLFYFLPHLLCISARSYLPLKSLRQA